MESRRELIDLVRDQVQIERESAARLSETEQKVGTGAAKLLLVEMRCDSQKHAAVLEALLRHWRTFSLQSPSGSRPSVDSLTQSL